MTEPRAELFRWLLDRSVGELDVCRRALDVLARIEAWTTDAAGSAELGIALHSAGRSSVIGREGPAERFLVDRDASAPHLSAQAILGGLGASRATAPRSPFIGRARRRGSAPARGRRC